ncbi:MAG TPA: glycosyltransferase family 4 protein, partial [Candidatus Limnocylindria bacterium]|nr:glycosyltransferase family 4 protein [Candidatus Limnocylindria bacterium]
AWLPPALHPREAQAIGGPPEAPEPTMAYAGNLDAYQNLCGLLQAFELVRERVPAARLVLVSHPDARRGARRLAAGGLPPAVEIVFASSYEDVRVTLARAHVLVLPRREATGYPMKLLNYMAAGKAIVATAGSGKGLRDGENARIVHDQDVAAFAAAVSGLLRDPGARRRLGEAARQSVADPARYARGMAALEGIYDEVKQT